MLGFFGNATAEGTKELEPKGAHPKSVCKIALSQSAVEYRIPFALLNCDEDLRLNIHISDFSSEKIYLGFGNITDYADKKIYTDVLYQVRDPKGDIVKGYSLRTVPYIAGSEGFISNPDQVELGPDISNSKQGYRPLVISPEMNGDYFIEFKIPDHVPNDPPISEVRILKYFDATVAKGEIPIPGRLWSKAWQLSSGNVSANVSSSFALFYIYTNDSIVTRFDCNGLAGGVWTIYSNEWGCSTTGAWSDRRRSLRGNGTVQPQYKIFLNDPDLAAYPSGHIGQMVSFNVVPEVCDTVITFEANVSKGGSIDVFLDIDPPNPGSFEPEDVLLGYIVKAGHNVLLPAWDGKDGNGIALANNTQLKARIRFLNGLSNVPLYDVEDNPNGFKVDIERPNPASGNTKLKLFWDDTKLPPRFSPGGNVTEGCLYNEFDLYSGCHQWTRLLDFGNSDNFFSLGDTNTINTWWYLTTDDIKEEDITLKIRPSTGHITGQANICKGQTVAFNTSSIDFAQKYIWQLTAPGFSTEASLSAPDTTLVYNFTESMPAGEYLVSLIGRNPVCGDGEVADHKVYIHNRPKADFKTDNPCQGAGITFTDQSISADEILREFTWIVNPFPGNERIFHGNPSVIVFDTATNINVTLIASDLLGCTDTISRMIAIKPKPVSSFEYVENPDRNGELHFTNQTTGASEYSWNFGNGISSMLIEPVIKYDLEGNYSIMLVTINSEGCTDTAMRQYYYMPGLWLPNAFTPDNNNQNDIFRPVTERNTLEPYQLLVFDRWGQLIFKTTNPSEGWDGKYNGKPCQPGNYSYFLQYRDGKIEGSETVTRRGMVSLIR